MLKSKNKETIKSVFEGPELQRFASVMHVVTRRCWILYPLAKTFCFIRFYTNNGVCIILKKRKEKNRLKNNIIEADARTWIASVGG